MRIVFCKYYKEGEEEEEEASKLDSEQRNNAITCFRFLKVFIYSDFVFRANVVSAVEIMILTSDK